MPGFSLSLRDVNIAISFGLVLATAVTSTVFLVLTAESSINGLEDTAEASVNTCFRSGEDNVGTLADAYLEQVSVRFADLTNQYLEATSDGLVALAAAVRNYDGPGDSDVIQRMAHVMFPLFVTFWERGLNDIVLLHVDNSSRLRGMINSEMANNNKLSLNPEHRFLIQSNFSLTTAGIKVGSPVPWDQHAEGSGTGPGYYGRGGRAADVPCNSTGRIADVIATLLRSPEDAAGWPTHRLTTSRANYSIPQLGFCEYDLQAFVGNAEVTARMLANPSPVYKWAPIEGILFHLMLPAYAAVRTRVGLLGMTASADITRTSVFAARLSDGLPKSSRVYAVQRNFWTGTTMRLMAASHPIVGDTAWRSQSIDEDFAHNYATTPEGLASIQLLETRLPINCTEAGDGTIRRHARDVVANSEDGNFSVAAISVTGDQSRPGPVMWNDEGGVSFWVRGSEYEDAAHDLGFVMVVMVPRAAILSTVDAATAATRLQIEREFSDSKDERDSLYIIMYVSLSGFTLLLMVLAAICARSVASPLLRLQRDMTAVAELRLEDVDSIAKESLLTEIREIEGSFVTMHKRMRQYRSYLPALVLQEIEEGAATVAAPTGEVAICFTDIVGSTMLWESAPETMNEALELHNAILRKAIRLYGGYEVKTIGDAFMIAFADPVSACLFGATLHESLLDSEWFEEPLFSAHPCYHRRYDAVGAIIFGGITVRAGISHGSVAHEKNPNTDRIDYRGRVVNLAARCESVSPMGCTTLSSDLYSLIRQDSRARALRFTEGGRKTLKGIGEVDTYLCSTPRLVARAAQRLDTSAGRLTLPNPLHSVRLGSPQRSQGERSSVDTQGFGRGSASFDEELSARSDNILLRGGERGVDKAGSVAVVQMNGLSRCATHEVSMMALFSRAVSNCITSATRTQGRCVAMFGSMVLLAWNVVSSCAVHRALCLRCAGLLDGNLENYVVSGIASGVLTSGHVGISSQRFHAIISDVLSAAVDLTRVCQEDGVRCLAAHAPCTPESLRDYLFAYDVWGNRSGDERHEFYIEYPDFAKVKVMEIDADQRAGRRTTLVVDDELIPGPSIGSLWQRHFMCALTKGSVQDLQNMREMVDRGLPKELGRVVSRLEAAQREHPEGASYRIVAPFAAQVSKQQAGLSVQHTAPSSVGQQLQSPLLSPGSLLQFPQGLRRASSFSPRKKSNVALHFVPVSPA
eukprot:TRINITY_DN1960_c0_g1_i1.p1 TRINITY_DN1960_c0_g1~~TRINITY_DN1960_c0_g1_i1.p1  ORF type:complete len:1217 (+),score=225.16 TRINITY_DN1960_c0_g1_i1:47-3652(+)